METYNDLNSTCHPPATPCAAGVVIVSEFALNPWEAIRAKLLDRRRKTIVRSLDGKLRSDGATRTGVAFEFATHRIADMAKLVGDVQRALTSQPAGSVK